MSTPNCETYEIRISTWLDEGAERAGERELLDHIVHCESCRDFYAGARALEGLVAMTGDGVVAEEPSPELWERIQERASESPAGERSWIWRAAAVLVVGAALAFVPWPTSAPSGASARQLEIVLEADRGSMTESRFLEIAAEILRADRRYHFAMQEVMDKVIDDEWRTEGATSEGLTEDLARDKDEDEDAPFRV